MIQTAQTQTGDAIPEGLRVEEFLRDADLLAFYERERAALPDDVDDSVRVEYDLKVKRAKRAALFTEIALLEAQGE